MDRLEDNLSDSKALVIDSNPTSRSILVSQLRDFGVGTVVQCSRLVDARRQLEHRSYDVVLCEHYFAAESLSGQDLLDDLRRNQLLPFSTVFIMVTGEATYAKVAEAVESALDGYLLKPHKATQLGERLRQARIRKMSLAHIFAAIEAENFEEAANLCLQRFEERGMFWLYAARVGAELLMRLGRPAKAQKLYETIVAAKTLPWARLGVARAQLDAGQASIAVSTLENLISEDPNYADAYDVLGRAQFELGRLDKAIDIYRMASDLTPSSISRLQNLGMMTYYMGDRQEAEKLLDRTVRLGLESKMFDCQTLLLLAFARHESGDRKGLLRCQSDFDRLLEKSPDSARHRRLADIVDALLLIQQHKFAQALDAVRSMIKTVMMPEFDFESAVNLMALLAQLAQKAIQLEEVESVVDKVGMRFCASRAQAELLAGSAAAHQPYAERLRNAQVQVLKLTEHAMSLSVKGDPKAAVENLIFHGASTQNSKLIETAYLVLNRYTAKIHDAQTMIDLVQELRDRFATHMVKTTLGEQKRQAGELNLRIGGRITKKNVAVT